MGEHTANRQVEDGHGKRVVEEPQDIDGMDAI